MSKSLGRRKKIPAAPVSRIGQHNNRPMARAIKEKKQISFSKKHVTSGWKLIIQFIRIHYLRLIAFVGAVALVFVTFFTSTFAITTYTISLDEKSGCLTREYVDSYVRLHISSMWSHVLYSDQELKNLHPCLERLHLQWNPFKPQVLHVRVSSRKPVLRVKAQRINIPSSSVTAVKMFEERVASEDTRFMLPDGRIVTLDASPEIPEVSLRYSRDTQVENIAFSQEHVVSILQLHSYLQKEFGSSEVALTDTGIAHFSLPSVEHVYTTLRQDIPSQLGSLQAILRAATIDKSKLFSIDVRSGNAVVRYRGN